ncbi:hypothetical protein C8J57DRAFT_1532479 [Mycena rebaudengoi]|nr:hypothetical protein C8J57DRAFT_1532479 [Mycena rebaudengoi]
MPVSYGGDVTNHGARPGMSKGYVLSPMAALRLEYLKRDSALEDATESTKQGATMLSIKMTLEPRDIIDRGPVRNASDSRYGLREDFWKRIDRVVGELQFFLQKSAALIPERTRYFHIDPEEILVPLLKDSSDVAQLFASWDVLRSRIQLGQQFLDKYDTEYQRGENQTVNSPTSTTVAVEGILSSLESPDKKLRHLVANYPHHNQAIPEGYRHQVSIREWADLLEIPDSFTGYPKEGKPRNHRSGDGAEGSQQSLEYFGGDPQSQGVEFTDKTVVPPEEARPSTPKLGVAPLSGVHHSPLRMPPALSANTTGLLAGSHSYKSAGGFFNIMASQAPTYAPPARQVPVEPNPLLRLGGGPRTSDLFGPTDLSDADWRYRPSMAVGQWGNLIRSSANPREPARSSLAPEAFQPQGTYTAPGYRSARMTSATALVGRAADPEGSQGSSSSSERSRRSRQSRHLLDPAPIPPAPGPGPGGGGSGDGLGGGGGGAGPGPWAFGGYGYGAPVPGGAPPPPPPPVGGGAGVNPPDPNALPAAAPYGTTIPSIDAKLKLGDLPSWNGDHDTAIKYFWDVAQKAALGGNIPQTLGYWQGMRLTEGSPVQLWYATLSAKDQAQMRSHYLPFLRAIKDDYLGNTWQRKMNRVYEAQRFRQKGNEKESLQNFITRRIMFTRMLINTDDGGPGEVYHIMLRAPVSWGTVIVIENIQSTKTLFAKVTEYEEALVQASHLESHHVLTTDNLAATLKGLGINSTAEKPRYFSRAAQLGSAEPLDPRVVETDAPPPRDETELESKAGEENEDEVLRQAFQILKDRPRAAPPFPKNDHVKMKLDKQPPSPCRVCGSKFHWNRECPDYAVYMEGARKSAHWSSRSEPSEEETIYKNAYSILVNRRVAANLPTFDKSSFFEPAASLSKDLRRKTTSPLESDLLSTTLPEEELGKVEANGLRDTDYIRSSTINQSNSSIASDPLYREGTAVPTPKCASVAIIDVLEAGRLNQKLRALHLGGKHTKHTRSGVGSTPFFIPIRTTLEK